MKVDKFAKWDGRNFQRLFTYSPREAFEYRKKMLGDEIPVEYMTEEEKKTLDVVEAPVVETTTNQEETVTVDNTDNGPEVHTEELLKKLLDDNGVEYSHLAKLQGLTKKALEHNLI